MSKISINNDGGVKSGPPIKKIKKVKAGLKTKKITTGESGSVVSRSTKNNRGSVFFYLLVVVITAVVVGAGMHAWQKKHNSDSLLNIQKSARQTRIDFESRIAGLKDKISGFEAEKEELISENEELKKKAELIEKAKVNFQDEVLKLSFDYPARFGVLEISSTDKDGGKIFRGMFSDNEKFIFGCAGKDLSENTDAQKLSFLDSQGFLEKKDEYFFLPQGKETEKYKINPAKVINFQGGKALLVDNKSFISDEDGEVLEVDIGENVGVLFNLNSEVCRGGAFMNSDFGMLSLDDFIKIIESIKLK